MCIVEYKNYGVCIVNYERFIDYHTFIIYYI